MAFDRKSYMRDYMKQYRARKTTVKQTSDAVEGAVKQDTQSEGQAPPNVDKPISSNPFVTS